MLDETTPRELMQWYMKYQIDPWSQERADLRAAMVVSQIINSNGGRRGEAVSAEEFMPYRRKPKRSPADVWAKFKAIAASVGAKRVKRG